MFSLLSGLENSEIVTALAINSSVSSLITVLGHPCHIHGARIVWYRAVGAGH